VAGARPLPTRLAARRGQQPTPLDARHRRRHVVAANLGIARKELRWTREPAAALTTSTIRKHLVAVNEFATRLAVEAREACGALSQWLGERGAHELMRGILTPDSYLALELPGQPTRHVLLELDRGTEDHERLQAKARRYAKAIPRSRLHELDPLILLLVPSAGRARAVVASLADAPRPIAVEVWSPGGEAPLAVIRRCAGMRAVYRGARADDFSLMQEPAPVSPSP
jgi:protein involved in plasmid replication-relaxation